MTCLARRLLALIVVILLSGCQARSEPMPNSRTASAPGSGEPDSGVQGREPVPPVDAAPSVETGPEEQSSETPSPAPTPSRRQPGTYDRELSLQVGDTATFADGLEVSLIEIKDGRCPPTARCVWQGQINVKLRVMSRDASGDVHLGSVKETERSLGARSFALIAGKVTPSRIGLIVRQRDR
jgi:hypothetical protein